MNQLLLQLSYRTLEQRASLYQPVVKLHEVMCVVLVWYDGVDRPFSSAYASAAFMGQEASLSWTVDAYLTILAEPSQKIV